MNGDGHPRQWPCGREENDGSTNRRSDRSGPAVTRRNDAGCNRHRCSCAIGPRRDAREQGTDIGPEDETSGQRRPTTIYASAMPKDEICGEKRVWDQRPRQVMTARGRSGGFLRLDQSDDLRSKIQLLMSRKGQMPKNEDAPTHAVPETSSRTGGACLKWYQSARIRRCEMAAPINWAHLPRF